MLKAEPSHSDFLLIDLGQITIYNKRKLNNRRILNAGLSGVDKTYSESFNLVMKDLGIRITRGENTYEMSKPFNFNLSVEMPGFGNEYQFLYEKQGLELDKKLKIRAMISPIIIRMSHVDYLLIMKILFGNIAYDDGYERVIKKNQLDKEGAISDQEQKLRDEQKRAKEQKESEQLQKAAQLDPKLLGIDFKLDIETMNFVATHDDGVVPYARISLGMMRVVFKKSLNG